MAITFILHEATRTGAPRLGALIARELQREEEVRAIVMQDGPLTPWLFEQLGEAHVTVRRDDAFEFRRPFEARLKIAEEMLAAAPADIVYANSLAASVFALAAARAGSKSILHVHEKSADMINLLAHDVTKFEVMQAADAIVLAAAEIGDDVAEVFRIAPQEIETFGVAADGEAVRAAADAAAPPPRNAIGRALKKGARGIVGMCGHASARKGADIFLGLAAAAPEWDFLWVGGWRPDETSDNIAYEDYLAQALPNFYVTGAVDNPYPYMKTMDLFFLSSREDPNPLVLAEAAILGAPLLCFSQSTAVADGLGRSAMMCWGPPNVADALRLLNALSPERLRSPAFRAAGDRAIAEYDLKQKMTTIRALIARLRAPAAELEVA
jgi:hypothetical protein